MNTVQKTLGAVALVSAAVIVGTIALQNPSSDDTTTDPVAAAPRADAVEIVYARRFQVDKPYTHNYRADKPLVNSGWLMVLSAPTDKLQPTQSYEHMLFVGAQAAERVNTGKNSGRIVVIVPGDFGLADAPAYFGSKGLPEELDQAKIQAELQFANAAGATSLNAAEAAAVVEATPLRVPTEFELRLAAIDLVERFSPDEEELISGWRVPVVR